jgi:FkbM family methyltransferase
MRERVAYRWWKVRERFPITVEAGPGAGLHMSLRHASANYRLGTNELPVQETIVSTLRSGDVFYDVGSNVGFFSLIAARVVGAGGAVHAFEAVPEVADQIRRNARRNDLANISVHVAAVSDIDGQLQLARAPHPGGATTARPGALGEEPETISALTLDTFAASSDRPPDLVKIDVEGAETEVIAGMHHLLDDARPVVVFEIDDATIDGLERKVAAACRPLEAHGYEVETLPPAYEHIRWHVRHFVARPAASPRV